MAAISNFKDSLTTITCAVEERKTVKRELKLKGFRILEIKCRHQQAHICFWDIQQKFPCPIAKLEDAVFYFNQRGITITEGIPSEINKIIMLTLNISRIYIE